MAAPLWGHPAEIDITSRHISRSVFLTPRLEHPDAEDVATFSRAQNRAILIVAVTAASISLGVAAVSLGWFLSMKRSFRQHLILMLILSDSFKALWYLISPIVIFHCTSCGDIQNPSVFTKASGFFLAAGIEAADLSNLFIALHTTLYIFRPPKRLGNGGLYSYRYLVYGLWLGLPLLAASLAFTNPSGHAYVTSGTFAYLPKRPIWYRLALAWIPRYIIIISIIGMYTAIYIYVRVRFRGFHSFASDELSFGSSSMQTSEISQTSRDARRSSQKVSPPDDTPKRHRYSRMPSASSICTSPADVATGRRQSQISEDTPGWEMINFITGSPVVGPERSQPGHKTANFAPETAASPETPIPFPTDSDSAIPAPKKPSTAPPHPSKTTRIDTAAPAVMTNSTPTTPQPNFSYDNANTNTNPTDPLLYTRFAIRRQLRFLFIYPLVYMVVWLLPFAQHCLNYTDYYTEHPRFWLSLGSTTVLALQAGIDCTVFSWRERPWRRLEEGRSPLLVVGTTTMVEGLVGRWCGGKEEERGKEKEGGKGKGVVVTDGVTNGEGDGEGRVDGKDGGGGGGGGGGKREWNWWEEEGRKRRDSVWLGTV